MKLKEYVNKHQINRTSFAASLGISYTYLLFLMNGMRTPKIDLAYKIREQTNGEVTLEDWRTGE